MPSAALLAAVAVLVCGFHRVDANGTTVYYGTVLFTQNDQLKECWTMDEVALLTTRMLMRNLMPHVDAIRADDDTFVSDIIDYFRLILEVLREKSNGKVKHLMLLAYTDCLGGYMKHIVLPMTKYSYYAGNIAYSSVIKLYQLYDEIKNFLRTNGASWAKPWKKAGKHIKAKAISLQSPTPVTDPCKGLIFYKPARQTDAKCQSTQTPPRGCSMEVPLPFFDSKSHPAAIAVPFKTFGLRNLESRVSAYILVKFYVAVSKCMASRNVNVEDVQKFNANVFTFIMAKVMPHLSDDKFYAAFGGVLRILETIKENGGNRGGDKIIGNFNIMPEIDREPFPTMTGEETDQAKQGAAGENATGNDKKTKNNLILIAALATIIIWFCLGAIFVCCRIRVSKMKKEEQMKALENPDGEEISGKGRSDSTIACKENTCVNYPGASGQSSRSAVSHQPADTPLGPSTSQQEQDKFYKNPTPTKSRSKQSKSKSQNSLKSTTQTNTTEGEMDMEDSDNIDRNKPPELQVQSMQYYPPSFACHTSMTGKFKMESSTEDFTSKEDMKRPYVFGYDFQTTSEETSPRPETTDGENELGGNMSK